MSLKDHAARLASDIRNGDMEAYELFYRMEFNNLVHYVESYTHDRQSAEDIAQETLFTLWDRRNTLNPDRDIRPFTYRIARNRTINALKRKSLFADRNLRTGITNEIMALKDESMEGLIESLELEHLIEEIYSNLPESARESFEMSRKEGMTNKEIAEHKNLSVKAIEYHIHISLRMFRKMLGEYLDEGL